ncbi:vacuolar protein sorting-associated protein 16 [Trichomonascus vanleenenianus]|uniref:tethering complex subunit VPS16 n=1 Tax=Trichomonascus vanleenenianus TaxID=2268995 RepID=UPI003EC9B349
MPPNPALSWDKLHDSFYRTFEGYSMLWDIDDVSGYIVASAVCGGAIAMYRDPSVVGQYRGAESRQTKIYIYNGAGVLQHTIPWDNGRIRGFGWNELEQLVVVSESGNVRVYYDFGGNFFQVSLGRAAEINGVVACRFWRTGFVALLANNRFVSLTNYREPNAKVLADLPTEGVDRNVRGWGIVPQEYNLSQHFELLVATADGIFHIDSSQCRAKSELPVERVVDKICVSPNGQLAAFLEKSGRLTVVGLADASRAISNYSAEDSSGELVWCGNDAVGLVGDDEITLVGPNGHSLPLLFDNSVKVFTEVDGMRVLTNEKHDLVSRVPDMVVDIFRLGSTSPAAILRDCVDQIDRKSPKADENLLIIADRLPEAVDICIAAAGYEFEPYWQKKLLKAASFGKAAIHVPYDSDPFVQMCDYLRVLNSVRRFEVGILLDYFQLKELGPANLIDRLLMRNMHQLAFKCCELLKLPTEKVYVHWASAKIRLSTEDDERVCKEIIDKLKPVAGISYEEIARTAYNEGRLQLAVTLIAYEPRPEKQVPLLLDMKEEELALEAAVKSYNMNLLVFILSSLQQSLPLAKFFKMINGSPMASKCFELICDDETLLENFYYQDDRRSDSAQLRYRQALVDANDGRKLDLLEESKHLYAEVKSHSFEAKAVDEHMRLLRLQDRLEKDYEHPFVGLTLSATIEALLRMAQVPRATKVKEEFKVPDKRFWWLRLKALVSRRDWDTLYKFATSKKSPIGYEPFYNQTLQAGSKQQAARYISHCTSVPYTKRVEMYVTVGDIRQAAHEALKGKDATLLQSLRENTTPTIQSEIDTMLSTLK